LSPLHKRLEQSSAKAGLRIAAGTVASSVAGAIFALAVLVMESGVLGVLMIILSVFAIPTLMAVSAAVVLFANLPFLLPRPTRPKGYALIALICAQALLVFLVSVFVLQADPKYAIPQFPAFEYKTKAVTALWLVAWVVGMTLIFWGIAVPHSARRLAGTSLIPDAERSEEKSGKLDDGIRHDAKPRAWCGNCRGEIDLESAECPTCGFRFGAK
jgi:hypothetical protein